MRIFSVLISMFMLAAPTVGRSDSKDWAQEICSIIDRYKQGSYHFFDCLNHIEGIDSGLNLEQTIDFVCGATETYYGLDADDKTRCFKDAGNKLNPRLLKCQPAFSPLDPAVRFPSAYSPAATASFGELAKVWNKKYQLALVASNNGLVADLQLGDGACLASAYSISLDGPNPLQDALKECVFTDINAYSGPAISPEAREQLSRDFVAENWDKFRFHKLINASLQFDPIEAFNTRCVVAVSSRKYTGYTLFLAGFTID